MARAVNKESLDKIRQWEGLRLTAYKDSVGVWTIGYGHTGADVKPGMTITNARADELLKSDLRTAERAVDNAVTVPLSDNQFGALVSFVFNVGVGAFNGSTLLRKLNAGDYASVPSELARWNKGTIKGKKVVIPGLVNRRAAEIGLWATGSFVSSSPVTAAPPAKTLVSGENIAAGGAVISSIAAASSSPGPLQWAFAAILVVAAVAVAVYIIKGIRS